MLNRAIIMGRLTATPELRQTAGNIPVTSFTVAVNRSYSKSAERQTDFIDVVVWRQSAEFVCRYFEKGSPIIVEGRIQVSSYTDRNNEKRKRFEIVADNVSFVEGSKASSGAGASFPTDQPAPAGRSEGVAYASGDTGDFEEIGDFEDLPF